MADSVSTFRAVCRGGLNTGADVLSLGEESPGSAIQLLNYEPNLEGGYRDLLITLEQFREQAQF